MVQINIVFRKGRSQLVNVDTPIGHHMLALHEAIGLTPLVDRYVLIPTRIQAARFNRQHVLTGSTL